jgi:hypothetical protein
MTNRIYIPKLSFLVSFVCFVIKNNLCNLWFRFYKTNPISFIFTQKTRITKKTNPNYKTNPNSGLSTMDPKNETKPNLSLDSGLFALLYYAKQSQIPILMFQGS